MRRLSLSVVILTAVVAGVVIALGTQPEAGRAAFPGANGKIAFDTSRDGNSEVYSMNPGPTNLTNNPANDSGAAWSADGKKIAFASTRDGNYEIYVMNADGTGQTRCTNNPADDYQPGWSPDGSKIAFSTNRDGNNEIYIINSTCTTETRCTTDSGSNIHPRWSPDGTKIVWERTGGADDIYVVDSSNCSGAPTNITNHPAGEAGPSWSPDGTKIAFRSNRSGQNSIYIMNADGTGVTRCTFNAQDDNAPAWSPDGAKIAFARGKPAPEILAFSVAGCTGSGEPPTTNLTNNAALDAGPDWQPLVAQEPTPVGGISQDPEAAGLPVESAGSSGTGVGLLTGIAVAAAAGIVALGGAAWYARRRPR